MGVPPKLLLTCSNGEVAPPRPDPVVVEAARRAAESASVDARRLGMDRRRFLRSSLGTAAALAALGACRDESGTGGAGGTFATPAEPDPDAAATTLGPQQGEVVIDVQTHFLDPDLGGFGAGFPQAGCGDDAALCFTIDRWADLVLGGSDTSLVVLSALPIVADDHPMSTAKMAEARRLAEALCGDGRVLLQGEAFPQVGRLDEALAAMSALAADHDLVAWKTYTHLGRSYSLVDDVGTAFLDHIESGTGPDVLAIHKGLGADPSDLGPAAAAHPGIRFLAYHAGFEGHVTEGPFDEGGQGVDRLLVSLRDAGVGPGGNVWCELGSTWKLVLTDPDAAAHVLGKLLVAVGPEPSPRGEAPHPGRQRRRPPRPRPGRRRRAVPLQRRRPRGGPGRGRGPPRPARRPQPRPDLGPDGPPDVPAGAPVVQADRNAVRAAR